MSYVCTRPPRQRSRPSRAAGTPRWPKDDRYISPAHTSARSSAQSSASVASSSPSEQVPPSDPTTKVSPSAPGWDPVQEAALLEIIRSDARVACAPRRVDLPNAATAGINCAPDTDLVA